MLKKILLILLVLLVAGLGISYYILFFISGPKVLIDNPTNNDITIRLDNKEFKIPALKNTKIPIKIGEHNLIVLNKENNKNKENITNFIIKKNISNKVHLLNPTKTDYIIWKTYYSLDKEPIPDNLLSKIKINGVKYEGFFEKINGVFIENTWDYDLEAKEPDNIEVEGKKNIIKSKLWRISEFKTEYFNRYPNEKPE